MNNDVTLPNGADCLSMATPLSAYSRLLGARCQHTTNLVSPDLIAAYGKQKFEFGEIWLDTLGEGTIAANAFDSGYLHGIPRIPADWQKQIKTVQTFGWRDGFSGGIRIKPRGVFNPHVAVLPCFKASDDGFGVRAVKGEDVLTYNGKVTYYPQSEVSTATRKRLAHAYFDMVNGDDQALKLMGGFIRPRYYDYELQKYQQEMDWCYQYKGKNYVRVKMSDDCAYNWVNCEPIKVRQTADGKIYPKQTLFTGSFDQPEEYFAANYPRKRLQKLDAEHYALGKYLNNELVSNLRNSTRLNTSLLTRLQTLFGRGLKVQTTDRERDC